MKAVIIFLALCLPALADLAAGKRALASGDFATALKEFLPLATHGSAEAQVQLGFMYGAGFGVPQDYKEALKWFRLAADQGYAEGQNSLGTVYDRGQGVPQDYKEALKWFRLATDQGEALAQRNVASECLAGVSLDPFQAHSGSVFPALRFESNQGSIIRLL